MFRSNSNLQSVWKIYADITFMYTSFSICCSKNEDTLAEDEMADEVKTKTSDRKEELAEVKLEKSEEVARVDTKNSNVTNKEVEVNIWILFVIEKIHEIQFSIFKNIYCFCSGFLIQHKIPYKTKF